MALRCWLLIWPSTEQSFGSVTGAWRISVKTILRKTICAVLAAGTLGGSMVGSTTTAEARGGAFAAGIIGGVALGAIGAQAYAPTTVYVAERRYVRRHRCGCVVHYHVYR